MHDASFRVYCNNGESVVYLHTFLFVTPTVGRWGSGYILVYYNHGGSVMCLHGSIHVYCNHGGSVMFMHASLLVYCNHHSKPYQPNMDATYATVYASAPRSCCSMQANRREREFSTPKFLGLLQCATVIHSGTGSWRLSLILFSLVADSDSVRQY